MIDNSNEFGFFTISFIKEIATKRLFLNGNLLVAQNLKLILLIA